MVYYFVCGYLGLNRVKAFCILDLEQLHFLTKVNSLWELNWPDCHLLALSWKEELGRGGGGLYFFK